MKKNYDSKFKSRVALEALRGELMVAEIAGKFKIHLNLVQQWKKKLQESASDVFLTKAERRAAAEKRRATMLAKKAAGLALVLLFAAPLAPLTPLPKPRTVQPDPLPSDPFVRETRRDAYGPGIGMDQYGRPTERRNREGTADPFTPTRPDTLGPGIGTDATGRPTTVKPRQ